MAKEKKLVEAITPMDKDFTQWYTDAENKGRELISYSNVKRMHDHPPKRICNLGRISRRN